MNLFKPVLVAAILAIAACSDSSPPAASTTAATPAAAPAATAAAVTGIAECDNFLSAYEQCITTNAPAEDRSQLKAGIDQWKTAWAGMAANDATKASLPQMCEQARSSSAPALQAYGCTL